MDAKESLKLVLDALHQLKRQHITRSALIDMLRGVESRAVKEQGLEHLEIFGQGDKREELHYNMVIDQAIDEKYLKEANGEVTITPKGGRFRNSPTPFVLVEEEAEKEPEESDGAMLDSLVENTLTGKDEEDIDDQTQFVPTTGQRSTRMIHLLQAIDRKVPLDDYAEQNQLDFDEVLDDLQHLILRGTQLDITYFTNLVLEKESQDELFDYFDQHDGNVERAMEYFYGIYQPEEIRLARLVWKP